MSESNSELNKYLKNILSNNPKERDLTNVIHNADEYVCPRIDLALLNYLEKIYPEVNITPDMNSNIIHFKGGQRSVVQKLRMEFEKQNRTQ